MHSVAWPDSVEQQSDVVNDESERIWKEAVMASKILLRNLSGENMDHKEP
jgi:hypothetical protein